ncbi:MAG: hypothetical protein ABI165_19915 [Bryobacteraceae bacterium]
MPNNWMKTVVRFLAIPLIAALLYTGWTFYERRQEDEQVQREAQEREAKSARKFLALYGTDDVRITMFYASPAAVHRGAKMQLCYGVLNVKSLRMEPPLDNVYPAVSHCVEIRPPKTTAYKLVAQGKDGKTVTQTVTVEVK